MADSISVSASHSSDASSPSSASGGSNYTFLIANASKPPSSQHADQAPHIKHDRFAHTRTKRKRTSREDFAILEAEYQTNSKPDKETRASLASRVSMSEKEIQVWFQNRRQMTRRKRHTWQPNEITSIIRSSQDLPRDANPPSSSPTSSFETNIQTQKLSRINTSQSDGSQLEEEQHFVSQSTELTCFHDDRLPASQETLALSQPNASSFTRDTMQSQNTTASTAGSAFTPRKLKRTSSMVRLAMSLDGEASVILRGQTPSPPNKTVFSNPAGRSGLHRSKSLIAPSSLSSSQDIPRAPLSALPRVPGRSRDTRNWEFWCDSERRDELTKCAEIDQRGSAAGPISLIRSGSSNIGPSAKVETGRKKRKSEEGLGEKRPKLSRTKSSYARLQSSANGEGELSKKKDSVTTHIDGSDSDKENVDPKADAIHAQRRVATPRVLGNKRQVLQENTNVPSHSTSLGVLLAKEKENTPVKAPRRNRKHVATSDQENISVDKEVASFMKGGTEQREEDDMDAVQNLLRLSQGAWR